MTRRAKDPNAKRMFQLRLDPNDANEQALIQFLDGQARWQSTLTFLMKNHINQYGTGDVFVALASGQTPVVPSQATPKPQAKPTSVEPKVEQPVQPEPQPMAVPKPEPQQPQSQPQSNFAPQPDMNPFDNNSGSTAQADLKANNDSFRNLM